jgi:hypothetical protein
MLHVGTAAESITVTAQGTPVNTVSGERPAELTDKQIEMLMSRSLTVVEVQWSLITPLSRARNIWQAPNWRTRTFGVGLLSACFSLVL